MYTPSRRLAVKLSPSQVRALASGKVRVEPDGGTVGQFSDFSEYLVFSF